MRGRHHASANHGVASYLGEGVCLNSMQYTNLHGSHSSVGQSVRLITERSAVQARVGPFASALHREPAGALPQGSATRRMGRHRAFSIARSARAWAAGHMGRGVRDTHVRPPWPNGQGVGPLIRRLRVRVPQGVLAGEIGVRRSTRRRDGALAFFAKNARVSLSDAPNTMLQSPRATATAYVGEHLQKKTARVRADPEENTVMRPSRAQLRVQSRVQFASSLALPNVCQIGCPAVRTIV